MTDELSRLVRSSYIIDRDTEGTDDTPSRDMDTTASTGLATLLKSLDSHPVPNGAENFHNRYRMALQTGHKCLQLTDAVMRSTTAENAQASIQQFDKLIDSAIAQDKEADRELGRLLKLHGLTRTFVISD